MKAKKQYFAVVSTLVGLCILTTFALTSADTEENKNSTGSIADAKEVLSVTTTAPRIELFPDHATAHGNIVAWQEASIGAETDGLRLTEVRVNVGDKVKKGQLIAIFASATIQAELNLSRAESLEAKALYEEALVDLKRATELKSTGALSNQQIQRYITAEQSAKAKLEAAKAKEYTQKLRLEQTHVLAPDHGIISVRTATVGAVVPAGQELFRLIRGGRLEWRAEVSSEVLKNLKPDQIADISLADGSSINGTLRMVSPIVDTQTRNALVYVDLPTSTSINSAARAGMFARGRFNLGSKEVMTLPVSAVQIRDGFSYVFRVGADSKVVHTKVKTGSRTGDRIEITSGVKLSDMVVATGGAFLGDGDRVKVLGNNKSSEKVLVTSPSALSGPMK